MTKSSDGNGLAALVGGVIVMLLFLVVGWAFDDTFADRKAATWAAIAAILAGFSALGQAAFAAIALDSLKHARKAADAADKTLTHQQETTEKQLRAYFDVVEPLVECTEEDRPIDLCLVFKNAGATPLLQGELRWRAIHEEREGEDCTTTRYSWVTEKVPPVLPSDTWPLMIRIKPGMDRFNRPWFLDGRISLVIEYTVDYRDAFPTPRHTTNRLRMVHKDDGFILIHDGGGAMT